MPKGNITLSIGRRSTWQFGNLQPETAEGKGIIARFWAKVERRKDSECWPFRGHVGDRGYGVFGIGRSRIRAHRLAWMLTHGDVPAGVVICHDCDTPACCNPSHLRPDTQAHNLHESIRKGRKRCWGIQKLTDQDVLTIRALCAGGMLQYRAAELFGISENHVSSIVHRKVWAHLVHQSSTTPVHAEVAL
jgi:hypothetical protein